MLIFYLTPNTVISTRNQYKNYENILPSSLILNPWNLAHSDWPQHSGQGTTGIQANASDSTGPDDKLLKGRDLSYFNSKFPPDISSVVLCPKQAVNKFHHSSQEWMAGKKGCHP